MELIKCGRLLPLSSRCCLGTITVARADDLNALLAKGDALDATLQTQPALDLFLSAEKQAPSNAELLRRVARGYGELMADTNSPEQKKALGEKALSYAQRAVACDPKNAMAQLAAAVCYGRLAPLLDNRTKIGYSRLVKEHADKALALDPNCDLTYHVLGVWNYELASLNSFLRALAEMIYGKLPDASYEEAAKNFRKAILLNPDRLANHVELGRTYFAMGNAAGARQEETRALAMPNREKDDPYEKDRAKEVLRKI